MKYLLVLLGWAAALTANAGTVFTSYDDYYQQQQGVFSGKALEEPSEEYSMQGEHGMCGEEDACQDYNGKIGSKKIKITVSLTNGAFQLNGRSFVYRNARTLDDIKATAAEIPLHGVSVYVAPKIKRRPDMICIDGYYMGSGKFRNTQIFLVVNPFGPRNQIQFLHLPSLHSSCMAIQQESDGSISYPSNSYIPAGDAEHSTGLLMKYFALKKSVSRPLNREVRLRFIEVGNPFKFSVE
jgi:hypothetical protein